MHELIVYLERITDWVIDGGITWHEIIHGTVLTAIIMWWLVWTYPQRRLQIGIVGVRRYVAEIV